MQTTIRILLVEDELKIAENVRLGLMEYGLQLTHAIDADLALALIEKDTFDLYIFDIMLPSIDGLTLLKQRRECGDQTPVILLTARNQLNDRLEGLHLGADDYLAKPFFVEELYARIQAILRRSNGEREHLITVGKLKLDRLSRQAFFEDRRVDLSTREFALLEYLMRSPGKIFTRMQILEHVWGYDFDPSTNIVDVCVKRIRAKMSEIDGGSQLSAIESVRGIGYRFRDLDEPSI